VCNNFIIFYIKFVKVKRFDLEQELKNNTFISGQGSIYTSGGMTNCSLIGEPENTPRK
jgi:hypothetical protein